MLKQNAPAALQRPLLRWRKLVEIAPENLDRPCGRGIMLMKAFLSRVEYVPPGNLVILEKSREANGE